jgi:hypothetical protein
MPITILARWLSWQRQPILTIPTACAWTASRLG